MAYGVTRRVSFDAGAPVKDASARRYMSLESLAQTRIRLINNELDELPEEVTPALEPATG